MSKSNELSLYGDISPFGEICLFNISLIATYGWLDWWMSRVSRHYLALNALFPVRLGPSMSTTLNIEGLALDRVEDKAIDLLKEIFPLTCTDGDIGTIEQFERIFDLNGKYQTLAQRRLAIVSKMVAPSGLNLDYFYSVAEKLGYNKYPSTTDPHIEIKKGQFSSFRVGISLIGIDKIYDQTTGYSDVTWVVEGTGIESDTILRGIVEANQPGNAEVIFHNA